MACKASLDGQHSIGDRSFEVAGASYVVNGRTVLQPLDVQFKRGRVHGLIGHNGSGKTTLLKLLARQQPPSSGTVRLGGKELKQWEGKEFARIVAYLPQQTPTTDGMTVRELVTLGRYPWHGALGRFSAEDRRKVDEAMVLTDVEGFACRTVDSLSGGERQRAWLAMLVAQDSEWLLLDEPISALDIGHQLEVLGLVKRLSEIRGLGVIMVLHDINMAARFCNDLVALREGRLLVRGVSRELMRAEILEDIYGVRMGVLPGPVDGLPIIFAC
ncbi:ATP-binding cassette domain-containing protein [Burkholderia multivorans]|uniref:ATP-binding cassette domain-containing protein n=1 Tax=Burkholderia multivorans TaxID=87883 RepID=UPI001C951D31|nr:ATP-binding cassette domain-containing protein [Burkholderia multivorans]MBY4674328.1 ATP-binding cassette domain-containing protein [Burkholderia multivorans]